ncbi:NADH-quinone oxidoreductase subunit NuoF [Buchnera aphidicola]|uniref:NADH-quinone oxidoreductase subunit F n=1 Tax=Buchnera aphidicola (Therioaphis trifolii) TaxID=1241884 RepID=A0A4D6YMS7_9GAMM|nr:NADH-quinone oxidoreductase subunit NuoF [Buchnera aphidicola]QCI27118.1 NADH oxidoreductase (quinone) subunit F [Buchnera aphidicola (Therioaphis trifolii)]
MNHIIKYPETHPLTWRLDTINKNPIWINEYHKKNGYSALKFMLNNMTPKDVINLVKDSELRGRGGAGFYTGIKWSLMPKKNNIPRYLLCNADEMEPGTYKDRLLLEQLPHQLLEGMIISGFAIEATMAYIFLRGEYISAENNLKKAIIEAENCGYLGRNILGSDFTFKIVLHTGAGRYICGEETALINSLEGKRANPRIKPPFPAIVGLWGKPTCVNNVETLSNIPAIVLNGSNWYKKISLSKDRGTKLMGFSGRVNNPGVWEVPFGISARELLEDYAKGMKKGFRLKAWQPGGAGTDFLTEKNLDVKMDFDSISKVGSRFGTGIAMAVDHTVNIVSLVLNLEKFFSRESCGLCTPCREGLPWIVKILQSFEDGFAQNEDINILEDLCVQLGPGKTVCAHAPGAMEPLQSAIKLFRSEFEQCIRKNSFSNIEMINKKNMFKLNL